MNIEDFEDVMEEIGDIFEYHSLNSSKIRISKKNGEIIIYTGLYQDSNGNLSSLDDSDYDEDSDISDFQNIVDGDVIDDDNDSIEYD